MTAFLLVLAYFIGSIPFGLLLSKAMGQGDLRAIGSGNIGATNALRTGNKKLAALTLLGDLLKGSVAVLLARLILPEVTLPLAVTPPVTVPSIFVAVAGLLAVLGHIFPVWLKFKGGKGVATALGVLLALTPLVFFAAIATWLIVFKLWRISSLAALVAFALAPLFSFFISDMHVTFIILLITMIIFITHRANINRLLQGEESSFKNKK
ncbi:MAG: glycerol-3-phosphate 1-O-acyltransferase PlsY [Alphaproteobacteria bacterium]|nr:glycerol-3-phosphate 1-O-acyltransferase PlsY [Alphaproteobacteria bacterium]